MKTIHHPLLSIPGIGQVTAALLIAEIGDITRFDNQAKLAKYAGLTWRKRESGHFRAEKTVMTKSGNVYLRYAFLIAAQCLINHNDEYHAYYRRKYNETPRHAHKRALSLTARKLVRLVYAMWTKNQLYMAPEERIGRNQEVNQEKDLGNTIEVVDDGDDCSKHKKVKSTVAARSSSRQEELNGFKAPPEHYAVNT